jgi:hypothetical protein
MSRTVLPPSDGGNCELDRIGQVDELPFEVELLREPLRERLDPDALGCVVAGGHEVDS